MTSPMGVAIYGLHDRSRQTPSWDAIAPLGPDRWHDSVSDRSLHGFVGLPVHKPKRLYLVFSTWGDS
jgi:hypothetical protein